MILSNVKNALREAHSELPQKDQLVDLVYLVDVDPYGSEVLMLYVEIKRQSALSPEQKREIESRLRDKLTVAGFPVFFRWFSEDEASAEDLITGRGVFPEKPQSALH
jgi:hypothetical protein